MRRMLRLLVVLSVTKLRVVIGDIQLRYQREQLIRETMNLFKMTLAVAIAEVDRQIALVRALGPDEYWRRSVAAIHAIKFGPASAKANDHGSN